MGGAWSRRAFLEAPAVLEVPADADEWPASDQFEEIATVTGPDVPINGTCFLKPHEVVDDGGSVRQFWALELRRPQVHWQLLLSAQNGIYELLRTLRVVKLDPDAIFVDLDDEPIDNAALFDFIQFNAVEAQVPYSLGGVPFHDVYNRDNQALRVTAPVSHRVRKGDTWIFCDRTDVNPDEPIDEMEDLPVGSYVAAMAIVGASHGVAPEAIFLMGMLVVPGVSVHSGDVFSTIIPIDV